MGFIARGHVAEKGNHESRGRCSIGYASDVARHSKSARGIAVQPSAAQMNADGKLMDFGREEISTQIGRAEFQRGPARQKPQSKKQSRKSKPVSVAALLRICKGIIGNGIPKIQASELNRAISRSFALPVTLWSIPNSQASFLSRGCEGGTFMCASSVRENITGQLT